MESKFIPVRGNPSSPTKNTDCPSGRSVFFFSGKMESKFIPVRGNPSSPTKNTDCPSGRSVFFFFPLPSSLFPHSLLFPFETCRFRESVIVNTHRKRILQQHRNARQMHGAEKNLDRLRQHREEKPHMIRPPTPWAGFCRSAPLTLPVRSGARPAPAATGRPRACQSNRRTPSARRARTATGTHLPTPAAAQNTPRIAASAFLPSGCKIIMHLDNFRS